MRFFLPLTVAVALTLWFSSSALARQEYNRTFWETYKDELGKYKETERCNACHAGSDKKNRNEYGKAVGTALGSKDIKDVDKIKGALTKAAKEKSPVEGKTFGDLIKEGKLPGKNP